MSDHHGPASHSFVSQRLRMHYADWGNPDAPLLILQHGGRDHGRSWDWVAEQLRHDYHVIVPDLRGHCDSAWSPDADYTMTAFVADFAQLIEMLGADEVSICAHSLGGNIATRYAGLYPARVRRLANIEGLGFSPLFDDKGQSYADRLRGWLEARRAAAARSPRRYASIEDALARMHSENAYLTEAQARHLTIHGVARNEDGTYSWKFDPWLNVWPVVDMPRAEVEALWAAITCPVQLFYGRTSWATSPATDGRIDHFQNAALIEYDEAGHWLHHDQFARFVADLKAFLA